VIDGEALLRPGKKYVRLRQEVLRLPIDPLRGGLVALPASPWGPPSELDRAVYIGGVLILIRHLINGSTIAEMPAERYLDMRDGSNYARGPGPIR
jgi:hypothetical protein